MPFSVGLLQIRRGRKLVYALELAGKMRNLLEVLIRSKNPESFKKLQKSFEKGLFFEIGSIKSAGTSLERETVNVAEYPSPFSRQLTINSLRSLLRFQLSIPRMISTPLEVPMRVAPASSKASAVAVSATRPEALIPKVSPTVSRRSFTSSILTGGE